MSEKQPSVFSLSEKLSCSALLLSTGQKDDCVCLREYDAGTMLAQLSVKERKRQKHQKLEKKKVTCNGQSEHRAE